MARDTSRASAIRSRQRGYPLSRMRLNYLEFDYSEDADGVGTFDALAATAARSAFKRKPPVSRATL